MKSVPFETRAFYAYGHPKNPRTPANSKIDLSGIRMIGGFKFTDGAMSLYLPALKSERNAAYLERLFGIHNEVLQRVDVPTRSRTFSPQSESQGVLGLIDAGAPVAEGQPTEGSGPAKASGPDGAALEAIRGQRGVSGAKKGSSVATPTKLDAAQRAALLGNGPGADKLNINADDLT
jgi:hypothetical protein